MLLMDDLNNYVDGDVSKLALKTDVSTEATRVDGLYAIMQENVGGALRHQLAESANIDFANTAWVDLGNLSWVVANLSENVFSADISNKKNATSSTSKDNLICSLCKTVVGNDAYNGVEDMSIGGSTQNGMIFVCNKTYTDATVFKNAMKGILLAYEKAS